MRSLFICFIALTFLLFVVFGCDVKAGLSCENLSLQCIQTSTTQAQACACFGTYSSCLEEAGCMSEESYNNLIIQCEQAGCSAEQCSDASRLGVYIAVAIFSLIAF